MNLGNLKKHCVESCHIAYNDFKEQMNNSPFDNICFLYLNSCIDQLVIDAKCKVTKGVFKTETPNEKQCKIMDEYIEYYISITIETAYKYGLKRLD